MRRAALAAAALVAGALVGAMALQPPPDALEASSARDAGAPRASVGDVIASATTAPAWDVGDAWRVQFGEGDPICWVVVVAQTSEGYQQGVWCPTDEATLIAAQLAGFDVRYAGLLTKDLAGVGIGGVEETRWFDWPLEDGKSWPTSYQGDDAQVTVELDEEERRYELSLCLAFGGCVARYDYDPRLAWWSEVIFESGSTFQVRERTEDWTGSATIATASERYHRSRGDVDAIVLLPETFTVEPEDELVALVMQRLGSHTGHVQVRDGGGSVVYDDTLVSERAQLSTLVAGEPGTWTLADATIGIADSEIWARGLSTQTVVLE